MEATFALAVCSACQWPCLSVGLVSGPASSEGEDGEALLARSVHVTASSGKQLVQEKHLIFLKSVSKHSCMNRDSVGWYQGVSPWDISVISPALFPSLPSCEDCCQVTLALVTFENTRMPYLLLYFTWVFPHPIPNFLGKWKQQEKQVNAVHSERMRDENPRKGELMCRAGLVGTKVGHWESVLLDLLESSPARAGMASMP